MANFQSSTRGSTFVFVLDVGHGNMVLIRTASGQSIMFDCNVTDENETRVLREVRRALEDIKCIDCFICSHRDADHIRGIKRIHEYFPICEIVDSGHAGTTTDSEEYKDYMNLRNRLQSKTAEKGTVYSYDRTNLHVLSARDNRLSNNANEQGIVLQVEYPRSTRTGTSTRMILPGDSGVETWENAILMDYNYTTLQSQVLLAAHHGSDSFFKLDGQKVEYTEHIEYINPHVVMISVGPNQYGHPHQDAMRLYREYSMGDDSTNQVETTEERGSMAVCFTEHGDYSIHDWNDA